jgi:allantoate deiminase
MMTTLERAIRIMERIGELACVSEDSTCITRTYGTTAFISGRQLVEKWMTAAGLFTWTDNIGNIRGRLNSAAVSAKTLVIASHIDTIVNAGKYDGSLGVIAGIEIVAALAASQDRLPFNIELVGFCDEEGCRFHTTYLGSKAIAGSFDRQFLQAKDRNGISLGKVLTENGGDVDKLSKDALARDEWLGYFEIHIEQGPVLFEKNIPVALVAGIAGQSRLTIQFNGEAGHAGTVPMRMRRDALTCAAECVLEVERYAKEKEGSLVATVGKLTITHAASNVIPGEVSCSLDIRSDSLTMMESALQELEQKMASICKERGIGLNWNLVQQSAPVACDETMKDLLRKSIRASGYDLLELVSGAGHDAVPISTVAPVAMLFVKCFKGISHHPSESVEMEDIAAALDVSEKFLQLLIAKHSA